MFNANPFLLQPMNVVLRSEGRMLEENISKDGLRLRCSLGMASREAFAS